jgi:hypothetical protein
MGLLGAESRGSRNRLQFVGSIVARRHARTPTAQGVVGWGMVEQYEVRVRASACGRRPHADDVAQALRLIENMRGLAAHAPLRQPHTDALSDSRAP